MLLIFYCKIKFLLSWWTSYTSAKSDWISFGNIRMSRDLSTTLNIQRTFTDFARTGRTWSDPKLSQKSLQSSAGAISGDISLVRVTSSCAGAADAVNLISRQIGSVSEHKELFMGSFLVPHHLPKDQTCLLHQTAQLSIFTFQTLISGLKTWKK